MKLRLTLAVALVAAAVPLKARAQQPWLADRRFGEGIGIRTGNLELHPGASAEVGYDSNWLQRSGDNNGQGVNALFEDPVVDVYRLRATVQLSMSTLGQRRLGEGPPPSVSFRAMAYAAYNELIAVDSDFSDEISKHRHVNIGASFDANFFNRSPVGLDVGGDYVRMIDPTNDVDAENSSDRDTVKGRVGVTWRPGGGLFQWRLGYEIAYNWFETAQFERFDNLQHSIVTRGRWTFLPRTALVYEGGYTWVRYQNEETTQNDGEQVRSRIGINGLITNHFGLLAMGGWSGSFYDDRPGIPARQYDSFNALAELKWFLMPQQKLPEAGASTGLSWVAAGYTRDFSTSYLGSFYQRDRGYANFTYFLGGVFLGSLEGGLSHVNYPTAYFSATPPVLRNPEFAVNRLDVRFYGEYRFSDTWAVNTTVRYDQAFTDTPVLIQADDGGTPAVNEAGYDDLEFSRWQAFLGLRWFM